MRQRSHIKILIRTQMDLYITLNGHFAITWLLINQSHISIRSWSVLSINCLNTDYDRVLALGRQVDDLMSKTVQWLLKLYTH